MGRVKEKLLDELKQEELVNADISKVDMPDNSILIYFDSDMDFVYRKAILKHNGVYYKGEVSINLGDYKDIVTINFPEYLEKSGKNIELQYLPYSDSVIYFKHYNFKIGEDLEVFIENMGSTESICPQLKGGEIFCVGPGMRLKICREFAYTYL